MSPVNEDARLRDICEGITQELGYRRFFVTVTMRRLTRRTSAGTFSRRRTRSEGRSRVLDLGSESRPVVIQDRDYSSRKNM